MVAGDRFRPEVLATVRDPTGSPVTMYWATTVLRTQVSRSPRSSMTRFCSIFNLIS